MSYEEEEYHLHIQQHRFGDTRKTPRPEVDARDVEHTERRLFRESLLLLVLVVLSLPYTCRGQMRDRVLAVPVLLFVRGIDKFARWGGVLFNPKP